MPYELDDFLDDLYTRLDEIEYDIELIRKQLTENWFETDKDRLIKNIECVKDDAESLYNMIGQAHGPYLKRE
jgi:hypothetical protein